VISPGPLEQAKPAFTVQPVIAAVPLSVMVRDPVNPLPQSVVTL
jgi:hypothetical protein